MNSEQVRERVSSAPTEADRKALVGEALRAAPDDPEILQLAALVHIEDEDPTFALSHAQRAATSTNDPNLLTQSGRTLFLLGDGDGAAAAVQKAAALGSDGFALDGQLLQLAGMLAADGGDLDRARELWEQVFEENPEIEGLGYDLAVLYVDQREEVSAVLGVIDTALQHPHDHERLLALRAEIERALAEAGEG